MNNTDDYNCNGVIVTLTGALNYGCIIQRWALERFLAKNEYNFTSFDFTPSLFPLRELFGMTKKSLRNKRFEFSPHKITLFQKNTVRFIKKRIRQVPFYEKTANLYKTYIVGSDQVFRAWSEKETNFERYLLSFATNREVKRIAYAASFGKDTVEGASYKSLSISRPEYKKLAKKFDSISVREESGIKVAKDAWGVDAVQVIDPTLLLEADDYSKLINNPVLPLKPTPSVFYYLLDETDELKSLVDKVSKHYSGNLGGIVISDCKKLPPVEQWLKGFSDSKFVVTDSFHGTIFAIINNTPFITIGNEERGLTRFESLLKELGLMDRLVYEKDIEDFEYSSLDSVNWSEVNAKLLALKKRSADWLLAQLKEQ